MHKNDENINLDLNEEVPPSSTANATTSDRSPIEPLGGINTYKRKNLRSLKALLTQSLINKQ